MKKLILLAAVAIAIGGCSKEEACDMTGQRYMKMMKEGTPLTEKDKACLMASVEKKDEEWRAKKNAERNAGQVNTAPSPKWKDLGASNPSK